MSCNSMYAVADLVFSPVFHRHPNLKIAFSEGGVGWIPYLLERMDATWEKHRFYQNVNQEVRPSELFRKHIWGCFIVDQHGLVEPGLDRHRPDAVGVRLPALRLPLAQQPQGGVGAVPRRPRRRGPPDRGAERPGAVQLPPMSDDEEVRVDGESDWEDQDLLTLDLAAERLTEEIVDPRGGDRRGAGRRRPDRRQAAPRTPRRTPGPGSRSGPPMSAGRDGRRPGPRGGHLRLRAGRRRGAGRLGRRRRQGRAPRVRRSRSGASSPTA